jgi:shikimate kinase
MYRNICLIGFPHARKTELGKHLYKYLRKGFVDTDDIIQRTYKTSIPSLISTYGNDTFLELEQDIIQSLQITNTVLSIGGSAIYNPDTMKHVKATLNSDVYYVHQPKEEFMLQYCHNYNNLHHSLPLEATSKGQELYNERDSLYTHYSDKVIDGSKDINLDIFRGETYFGRDGPVRRGLSTGIGIQSDYVNRYANRIMFYPI